MLNCLYFIVFGPNLETNGIQSYRNFRSQYNAQSITSLFGEGICSLSVFLKVIRPAELNIASSYLCVLSRWPLRISAYSFSSSRLSSTNINDLGFEARLIAPSLVMS